VLNVWVKVNFRLANSVKQLGSGDGLDDLEELIDEWRLHGDEVVDT
jgi:hypothetical protein